MEKPIATGHTQAKQLSAAVESSDVIVVVGYNTPYTPALAYIRDVVRCGEINMQELVTGWQTQNWRQLTTETGRQRPELSGGGQTPMFP